VPAKLAARVRVLNTGHGRKTDHADAASVATTALHHPDLRRVAAEDYTAVLRLLSDRRDQLNHRPAARRHYHRKIAEAKTPDEALRSLKRQLAKVGYANCTQTNTAPNCIERYQVRSVRPVRAVAQHRTRVDRPNERHLGQTLA
jgi:hypothetical protein